MKTYKIKNIELIFSGKKVRILAAAVTAFMLAFVLFNRELYLDSDLQKTQGMALLIISLIAAPVAGLLIMTNIRLPEKWRGAGNTLLFFLMPIVSMQMVESPVSYTHLDVYKRQGLHFHQDRISWKNSNTKAI